MRADRVIDITPVLHFVEKPKEQKGFAVLPPRWTVEQFFA